LKFGPKVVELGGAVVAHHFKWVLLTMVAGLLVWLIWRRSRKSPEPNYQR
jgi:hypothetical protein